MTFSLDSAPATPVNSTLPRTVAIIGGGPAGLMAAETLLAGSPPGGLRIDLFDTMPSVGRKFLLAGKGGLNLTHSEPLHLFATRYGARQEALAPLLASLGPEQIRAWALGLGVETFVGTSGRVFPKDMKAAPLLRAWLHRLRQGVRFHMRHRWTGWAADGSLCFATPDGEKSWKAGAVVLALGGGSWSRLGSDGAWVEKLTQRGIPVQPLAPSNCGFDVGWSEHFSSRFAGHPFKSVEISFTDSQGASFNRKGEFVATATGVEGSLVYAASALLREEIARHGEATFQLDLLPHKTAEQVLADVKHPRGSRSLSSHLKSRLSLDGVKSGLLHEVVSKEDFAVPQKLAAAIKSLPVRVVAARPLDEAISSAGGVAFEALDTGGGIAGQPGLFCAGEMLDWEAPTGGYLLTACLATGRVAGQAVLKYLEALKEPLQGSTAP